MFPSLQLLRVLDGTLSTSSEAQPWPNPEMYPTAEDWMASFRAEATAEYDDGGQLIRCRAGGVPLTSVLGSRTTCVTHCVHHAPEYQ